jgi:hypothetical protein
MRTEEVARWIFAAIHPVIGRKRGICSRTACLYLGGFQADRVDEIQSLNDGSISNIESRDLLFRNGSVIGKGCRIPAVSSA